MPSDPSACALCPAVAGVEGGGTTFRCMVSVRRASGEVDIVARTTVATGSDPVETLGAVCDFLSRYEYGAIGICTFGPVDLSEGSATYGCLLNTPKEGWSGADILSPILAVRPGVPYSFDTDVNAPALAEFEHYNANLPPDARKISSCAYVTVGTGVGAGLVVNGATVRGLMHPEAGHAPCVLPMPGKDDDDAGPTGTFYPWGCRTPFRGVGTTEGTVASVALLRRLSSRGETADLSALPDSHDIWDVVSHALACLSCNLLLTVSVERIVLGGGIMRRGHIVLPAVRRKVGEMLNGYVPAALDGAGRVREDLIVGPVWGDDAGIEGAVALGRRALQERDGGGN